MQLNPIGRGLCLGLFAIMVMSSCGTVPKEAVTLSYRMGEDLSAINKSYKDLVKQHFEFLRNERLRYLKDEWEPVFINKWVTNGRLMETAKGEVVWSSQTKSFTKPVPGEESIGLLSTIRFWAEGAMKQIEKKEKELLDPINKDEQTLLNSIDESFDQLYRANATITANLSSLRKEQDVQDEVLQSLKLNFRSQINNSLSKASENAEKGLEEIRKADQVIENKGQSSTGQ
jgi:hypothetical protein